MKIVKIRQDQFDMMEHLDQLGLLERAYLPGYTVNACVTEEAKDSPCGMIQFFIRRETLYIEWLYVEPAHRGEGCADLLLSTAFELRETGQIEWIAAYLPEVYGRGFLCRMEDTFLSDYFGENRIPLMGEWGSALMALSKHPKCLLPEKDDGIFYAPFAELPADKTKEALHSLSGTEEESMLYPVHELTRDFDGDTSFAAFDTEDEKRILCGGLLTSYAGKTLYIVLFFGSSRIRIGLWTRFVRAALSLYPERTRVAMIQRSDMTDKKQAALMDDLFQVNRKGYGRHTPATLLYAPEGEVTADALLWDDFDTDLEL